MGKNANTPPKPRAPQAIPLTSAELTLMEPYLRRFASASQAVRSAQESLESIAKTIAGRAGSAPDVRYRLDLQGRRLIPVP
jgi:hypothetical protein